MRKLLDALAPVLLLSAAIARGNAWDDTFGDAWE